MDFVEACRKMIALESTPTHGNREVAEFVAELCTQQGLHVDLQKDFIGDSEHINVIARPTVDRPSVEFLLQTHLDTNDPGPFSLWSATGCNPFDATIMDGKIYGLGSADVKLDFLCKLQALKAFEGSTAWKLPPVLVGTHSEETGMAGALRLIRKNKISAKMALIGEPSDLRLISAGKGYASVEILVPFETDEIAYRQEHNLRESTSTQSKLFIGKAAHSSTPQLGNSAITQMMEYLLQMPESVTLMEIDGGINQNSVASHALLEIDVVSSVNKPILGKLAKIYNAYKELERDFLQHVDQDFTPPSPTLNIGMIRTLEDHILISGSCRIPPIVTNEIYEAWMERWRAVCESCGSQFRVTDYKKPFRTRDSSILIKGCQDELRAMNLIPEVTTQASTNESSIFSRIGIDCVCFGPGKREGNVHTPTEHVLIEDLHRATDFYKRVIERFCL